MAYFPAQHLGKYVRCLIVRDRFRTGNCVDLSFMSITCQGFPFPERLEDLRTIPALLMCGIQYFEALIDDQLLPTSRYIAEMEEGGFRDVRTVELTPIHVVVYGKK